MLPDAGGRGRPPHPGPQRLPRARSAYAALAHGDIDTDLLRDTLAAHRPAGWLPDFAVDATTWARCDAECSPERGFYYHPSRHSNGQPIVAGWSYLWLVGLSQTADSWTAPADVHRLAVEDNLNTVAVARIQSLLPRLGRLPVTPLFAFDAGFDPVQLIAAIIAVELLISSASAVFEPPLRAITLSFAPPTHHGVAAAFLQLTQRLSATFCIALVTGVALAGDLRTVTATGLRHGLLICFGFVLAACLLSFSPALRNTPEGP